MNRFSYTSHILKPETYTVKEFDVMLNSPKDIANAPDAPQRGLARRQFVNSLSCDFRRLDEIGGSFARGSIAPRLKGIYCSADGILYL